MTPKKKAEAIVEKYMRAKLSIFTKMDSIPTVLSDYPTKNTAKMLARIEVGALIDHIEMRVESLHDITDLSDLKEWAEIRRYINSIKE